MGVSPRSGVGVFNFFLHLQEIIFCHCAVQLEKICLVHAHKFQEVCLVRGTAGSVLKMGSEIWPDAGSKQFGCVG